MKAAFFSAAWLATSIAHAAPPIDGWYSSLFGGYAHLPSNVNQVYLGNLRSNVRYNWGYDAGGSFGYKSNPMRYEGELTYLNANPYRFNLNQILQTGVTGYSNDFLAMANVYYDFPEIIPTLQPYLGVGIGYSWIHLKLNSTDPSGLTQYSTSDTAFTYQGAAGLSFNFAECYSLYLGYRYIATPNVSALGEMFQANLANLGAVYRFDGNRYK